MQGTRYRALVPFHLVSIIRLSYSMPCLTPSPAIYGLCRRQLPSQSAGRASTNALCYAQLAALWQSGFPMPRSQLTLRFSNAVCPDSWPMRLL